MRKEKIRAHCPRCRHQQIFVRAEINHWFHFVASILTAGLWVVSWIALCIAKLVRPWRCEHCGWHKPEFRDQPVRSAKPARIARLHPEPPSNPLISAETSRLAP